MEFIETKDCKSIYDDMLRQFPPEELKPYECFKNLIGDNYRIYQVKENIPVGYVILFETTDYILIDYLAVYTDFQSKGFGGKILESLKQNCNKKGCFLEVEKPDLQNPNTIRRIDFYERYGAERLPVSYIYPNSEGGLPMDLYYIPYAEQKPALSEVKKFLDLLFRTVHSDLKNANEIFEKIQYKN